MKTVLILAKNFRKLAIKLFRSVLFFVKTRVSLKYFVTDCGYAHPIWYCRLVENVSAYVPTSSVLFFFRYCKDTQTSYFGYSGHVWLRTSKLVPSTCRKLQWLSVCQKSTSSFTSFLRYYILKNPPIWLADRILAHNSRTRIFIRDWWWNITNNINFPFNYFLETLMANVFKNL